MDKTQKKFNIDFFIRRFDPDKDESPWDQKFTLQVERGMTVLDGLHKIKETIDPSLCFRFSCRMGVCGSCAMLINGSPTLACNTQILDVSDRAVTVAPLPNFDIIKDLVPDLVPMFGVHAKVMPYIKRNDLEEMETPTGEYFQTPHQLEKFLQFTYCIKCGACMAACPTMATDRQYPGPMPLTQAYRYTIDTRDDGGKERKDMIAGGHGVFSCHYAGECSNVCPKGVDPARAIQLMKKELVRDYFKLGGKRACAHVNSARPEPKPKVAAPPFSVSSDEKKSA
jgi:succinate dehydrogenase / fumarate reductase iron-sulfur subunit